jgi:hypothetical protein
MRWPLRERFDREARAVAALNLSHICTLHDVGHEGGIDFLVMKHLEGENLADRLARGPLPTAEVIRLGIEIADALDKAHRAGIVHRDLKPATGARRVDDGGAHQPERSNPRDRHAATVVHHASLDRTRRVPLRCHRRRVAIPDANLPEQAASSVTVVLNWPAALPER